MSFEIPLSNSFYDFNLPISAISYFFSFSFFLFVFFSHSRFRTRQKTKSLLILYNCHIQDSKFTKKNYRPSRCLNSDWTTWVTFINLAMEGMLVVTIGVKQTHLVKFTHIRPWIVGYKYLKFLYMGTNRLSNNTHLLNWYNWITHQTQLTYLELSSQSHPFRIVFNNSILISSAPLTKRSIRKWRT